MLEKAVLFLLAVVVLLGVAGGAQAHRVSVYAYVDGEQLKGESYFSDGSAARNSRVEIFDGRGRLMATAKTDASGQFAMALPAGEPPWKVVLNAGEGHRADYTLDAAELGLGQAKPAPAAAPQAAAPRSGAAAVAQDQAALEQTLGRLLDQKLGPIKAQLARLSSARGINPRDVLSGLGYILGLLGLAAYMRYRRVGADK